MNGFLTANNGGNLNCADMVYLYTVTKTLKQWILPLEKSGKKSCNRMNTNRYCRLSFGVRFFFPHF